MARKKKVAPRRRRRRSSGIGAIAPRRRRSSTGAKGGGIMDALMIAGGLVVGKIIDKQLAEKVDALKDGKIRGAALAAVGIFGGRMLPANLKGVANGIAASGVYTIAKELLPDTINGMELDSVGQLSPAEVDLIESMAIESEVNGLDQDVSSTVTGSMDTDVMSTVTGMDDEEDDEEENF